MKYDPLTITTDRAVYHSRSVIWKMISPPAIYDNITDANKPMFAAVNVCGAADIIPLMHHSAESLALEMIIDKDI